MGKLAFDLVKGKKKCSFFSFQLLINLKKTPLPPDAGLESQKATVKFKNFGIRVLIQFCTTCRVPNFVLQKSLHPNPHTGNQAQRPSAGCTRTENNQLRAATGDILIGGGGAGRGGWGLGEGHITDLILKSKLLTHFKNIFIKRIE